MHPDKFPKVLQFFKDYIEFNFPREVGKPKFIDVN